MSNVELNEFKWKVRRGVLELDYILQHFLEKQFTSLSQIEKQKLDKLLACQDPDLLSWLVFKDRSPSDKDIQSIVQLILSRV